MDRMDIIVVGAGIAGLSAAYTLCRAGHSIRIFDPAPGQAAAHVAAGRIAPVTESEFGESHLSQLCLDASRRWESWADHLRPATDEAEWYQRCGMIVAARDADDQRAIERLAEYQTNLGLNVERFTSRELRRLEPALSPRIHGGVYASDDHMVDNRLLLKALRKAILGNGAKTVAEQVDKVDAHRIETPRATYKADAVVLAPGAQLNKIDLPSTLPAVDIHPVKGQILRLKATGSTVFPKLPIDGRDVYLVPRKNGELVVGATVEDVGFDHTITAGAVHDLLRRARELVSGIDEMTLTETAVGFRPATLDHAPVIGPLSSDGPFIATGLYRNGILLSPIVGDEALRWVSGSAPSKSVLPFQPKGTTPS